MGYPRRQQAEQTVLEGERRGTGSYGGTAHRVDIELLASWLLCVTCAVSKL